MAKILAVDDDKAILTLIRRALEKEGHTVTICADTSEVEVAHLNWYDLILLDIMMPRTDGITFCRQIRDQVDCPILFLTAKTEEASVMYGLGSGGDDYITKPFGIGELRARVAAHLRREMREKRHVLSLGNIRLDLMARRMEIEEQPVHLTKSEYDICEFLALHREQVFSREQIFEHVFGYERESDETAITEHIKNIRAKCKRFGQEPIETVWGIGYKWTEK